jgi:outer membrane protein OmpA-like peptidoglycan-associated protein
MPRLSLLALMTLLALPAAIAQVEDAATAIEPAAEATPAEAPAAAPEVWWGNRSISFGNYIKFEKAPCVGDCIFCDRNMNDCETGCPCPQCDYVCEDCNDCPFDKIFFDLDKAVLRPAGIQECDKIVRYLNAHPEKHAIIEGHTCDLATEQYNVGLGQRRANAVYKYLVDHGINPARLQTRTYGEKQPWVGIPQRELNRRAIVRVQTY